MQITTLRGRIGRFLVNVFPNRLKYGTSDMFSYVNVENTSFCNRKCSYCPNSKYSRGTNLMDESLWTKIVDELAELRFSGIFAPSFYGEPLTDKRLPDLMKYARKKLPRARLEILTNGDFLDMKTYIGLESYVDRFIVTVHDPPAKEYYEGPKIRINRIKDYSSRTGLVDVKSPPKSNCFFPSDWLIIDWEGNVVICCDDYFSSVRFGNIKSEKIMDVWSKPPFVATRESLRKGVAEFPICKRCIR